MVVTVQGIKVFSMLGCLVTYNLCDNDGRSKVVRVDKNMRIKNYASLRAPGLLGSISVYIKVLKLWRLDSVYRVTRCYSHMIHERFFCRTITFGIAI